ncbi:response regulator transcription factor [Marmoricola sp. URHB0036]|uniref:response regulator transcription factor n=1 Tax=Marmoricola sp. URHB0036 TaxID=1298863 RepID=UPI00041EAF83|nr:response regulator transcription factor [Marmoricola sp. URHB0036]
MPTTSTPPEPVSVVAIDDSEDLLFLVQGALERSGQFHVVGTAADGEQGVAAVRAAQPDLVLLDILMPVMDGLSALPLIRQECPDAIVVMLSALGDATGMPQKAMSLGANGYIHKDGRIQALPEQLRVIIGGAMAERAARKAREAGRQAPEH